MDRSIIYTGAAAQDIDLLFPQRAAMEALGMLAQAVLGDTTATGPLVTGLPVVASATPSMQVFIGPGALFGLDVVDATAYGSLAADTLHQIVHIAVNLDTLVLPALVAPGGSGLAQCFLVEVQAVQSDVGQVVLPFWNAANTAQPYLGQGNSGASLPTQRVRRVVAQVVAGAVAATGSEAIPTPTAGWTPLATVVLVSGQTSITGASIQVYVPGPNLPFTLPQLSPGFSRIATLTAVGGTSGGNSGVFYVPSGVTKLKVTYTGGGGGGSGCQATGSGSAICGGGGGAGATEISLMVVTPGQAIPWTVGIGGPSQIDGGGTVFGSLPLAAGGQGTNFFGEGATVYSPGGTGGAATGFGVSGGDGGDGQYGTTVSISAMGGASYWGAGGKAAGGLVSNGTIVQVGGTGKGWGAGGGGTYDLTNSGVNFPGGQGAPGLIVIEY